MSDPQPPVAPETLVFTSQPEDRSGLPPAVWGVAALIVVVILGVILFISRNHTPPPPNTLQPPDAYAASLPISSPAMSESENLSGGKMTYLDGRIQNTGSRTVTSITVQVVFANDEAMPPSIQTLPLTLVRMTQPYIDIEPVSADPIKPGESRDFRLAFESIAGNWNQQMPAVRVIRVSSN